MESNFIHFYWAGPEGKEIPHFVYRNLNIWAKYLDKSRSLFIPILWCNEAVYKTLKDKNGTAAISQRSGSLKNPGAFVNNIYGTAYDKKRSRSASYKDFYTLLPKGTETFYKLSYQYKSPIKERKVRNDKETWEFGTKFIHIPVIVVNFESYLYNLGETSEETENFRFILEVYKLYNKPYYYTNVKDEYNIHFLANFGGLYFDIDFLPLTEVFFESMNQIRTEEYQGWSLDRILLMLKAMKYADSQNFNFILTKYCDIDISKTQLINNLRKNTSVINQMATYDVGFQIYLEPVERKIGKLSYDEGTLLFIKKYFEENSVKYKSDTEEYIRKAQGVFPIGLFQGNKYIGYEGLSEIQKTTNAEKLRKFSNYFKNGTCFQQYLEDYRSLGVSPIRNVNSSLIPLANANRIITYNVNFFRPISEGLSTNQNLREVDLNYKILYAHLFWDKFTRVFRYAPSTLFYTGYEKMTNFFKIADSMKGYLLKKRQKLLEDLNNPEQQKIALEKRQKLIEQFNDSRSQEIVNSNFNILKLPNADIILHRDKWILDNYKKPKGVLSTGCIIPHYTHASFRILNENGRKIKIEVIIGNNITYDIEFCDWAGNILYTINGIKHFKMLSHKSNSRIAIEYKNYGEEEYKFEDIYHLSTATRRWLPINKAYSHQEFVRKFNRLKGMIDN